MVNHARRSGILRCQPCERCGDPEGHGHHDDYARPLDINWLCRRCHKAWHRENGRGLNAHLIDRRIARKPIEPLLTVEDVAQQMHTTPAAVYLWIKEKALPTLKAGSLIRISKAELRDWMERERSQASQGAGQ